MAGYITDRDLPDAEREFPGIMALYYALQDPPSTFLGLVAAWQSIRAAEADKQADIDEQAIFNAWARME